MARPSVNFAVTAGSVATLAASLAGVAAADGYALPVIGADRPAIEGIVSANPPVVGPAGAASVAAPEPTIELPPLPPLQLEPARPLNVGPMPSVSVSDGPALSTPSTVRTVDVGSYVPAPTAAQPSAAAVAVAPAPAPTVVPAPTPPPAAPTPTSRTKAS